MKILYACYNKDTSIRLNSSSGGVFYELACQVLNQNGIVFGASWNKDWLVDIVSIQDINDLPKLMKSKYVQANVKDTFLKCKEYLEEGRQVLYSALPCQIHGLKNYLKRDYPNLLTIDICCHGLMPINIWKDYLDSIQRNSPIINIDMRDKSNGWKKYSFKIEYEDGYKTLESFKDNLYMKAFLSDAYLKPSCYNCKFKNEFSKSDLILGDYWNIDEKHKNLNDDKGISVVVCNTSKGENLLQNCSKLVCVPTSLELAKKRNGGLRNTIDISKKKEYNNKKVFNKVGIITLPLHTNFGGNIQNWALQETLTKLGYYVESIELLKVKEKRKINFNNDDFVNKYINIVKYNDYESILKAGYKDIVVGSDQVLREKWLPIEASFLEFTKDKNIGRVLYSASSGEDDLVFINKTTNEEKKDKLKRIKTMLSSFNGISTRELGLINSLQKLTTNKISWQCDPTLLLTKEDYMKLCKDIPTNDNAYGLYLLDKEDVSNFINNYCNDKNKIIPTNELEFLAMFRDSDFIITDSFHGCLFSLIFNKPFICIKNIKRGGERFNTLMQIFNIEHNIINSQEELDINLLKEPLNIDLSDVRANGINFLKESLR